MICKMNKMILLSLFKEIIYLWEVTEGNAVLIEVHEVEMEINWIQIISTIKLQNNAAGGTIKMNELQEKMDKLYNEVKNNEVKNNDIKQKRGWLW